MGALPLIVASLRELDRDQTALAGGKGAQLGALTQIDGVHVPEGFCVTTEAFRRIMDLAPRSVHDRLDELACLPPDEREAIGAHCRELRLELERVPIPDEIATAIVHALSALGGTGPLAVRSSATAEDSPTASFAGQHDSFLNVGGGAELLQRVAQCWGSLFTERAVSYRQRHGIGHRTVQMAVVVQRMAAAQASGLLFTADPLTGNRMVTTIEAIPGVGEPLVAGRARADAYRVRGGSIVDRALALERAGAPALDDSEVLRLAKLGRRIEQHFGAPQDIEWCLHEADLQIVQSRPITTLYPIPLASDDGQHVYISVGHQQMMTDAMKPLGLSVWQLITPRPMAEAGGRLFVDVTQALATPASRAGFLRMLERSDPLIADALQRVVARGDFVRPLPPSPDDGEAVSPVGGASALPMESDPAIVEELMARSQASIATLEREIEGKRGSELLDYIRADIQELRRHLFAPRVMQAIMAGIEGTWWLNEQLHQWLGERNAADTLTLSVSHNVSSEMGLALADVADVIRPHELVVDFLQRARHDDDFLDRLPTVAGGREARAAIVRWLDTYGARGTGEIDITRPRWRERPSALIPIVLGNVRNLAPNAARRRFAKGIEQAREREAELLARLRELPEGEERALKTKRMIDRVRTFIGFREYPKFGMVQRTLAYKVALSGEARRLVEDGVLRDEDDIAWLRYEELQEVVRTGCVDEELIRARKEAHRVHASLTPPRVLTSEGESVVGAYRRDDIPPRALVGLPVSSGIVEGRARVVLDMTAADLEAGDILVTAYTDPSWTPLFVSIAGLVTEVGGLLTHGAVVAREYGVPAVVGVRDATRRIRDGAWIRVDGAGGWVELLG